MAAQEAARQDRPFRAARLKDQHHNLNRRGAASFGHVIELVTCS